MCKNIGTALIKTFYFESKNEPERVEECHQEGIITSGHELSAHSRSEYMDFIINNEYD